IKEVSIRFGGRVMVTGRGGASGVGTGALALLFVTGTDDAGEAKDTILGGVAAMSCAALIWAGGATTEAFACSRTTEGVASMCTGCGWGTDISTAARGSNAAGESAISRRSVGGCHPSLKYISPLCHVRSTCITSLASLVAQARSPS